MEDERSSYRQIFKATSIFGGVQFFNIIIGIVRSKVAALLLGTDGFGIVGLFSSTIDMVRNITGLGINQSGVRDISESYGVGNDISIRKTFATIKFWYWITGLLGVLSVIILAPYLSIWTFGNEEYTYSFMCLSIILLFTSINAGQLAVLQGGRKIKYLAKSNLYGGIISLVFLIPFYYYWGVRGIVPYLIVCSLTALCFSSYYIKKLSIPKHAQSVSQSIKSGTGMMKLGVMLTLASTLTSSVAYLLRIFIAREGGVEEVGLFVAGFVIMETYIGLVFTAMGTDFYPRLSAVNNDNQALNRLVNHQAEIGVLILSPMLLMFMIFAPVALQILYSSKFIPATEMLQYAVLGVLLKATSWPLAFVLLAKAQTKIFFIKEVLSNIYYIGFNVLGYTLWGLKGLGIGFVLAYICNLMQISLIMWFKYRIRLGIQFVKILVPQYILCILVFMMIYNFDNYWKYLIGGFFVLISLFFSYNEMNKRLDLITLFKSKLKK